MNIDESTKHLEKLEKEQIMSTPMTVERFIVENEEKMKKVSKSNTTYFSNANNENYVNNDELQKFLDEAIETIEEHTNELDHKKWELESFMDGEDSGEYGEFIEEYLQCKEKNEDGSDYAYKLISTLL